MNISMQLFLLLILCLGAGSACSGVKPHATEAELLVPHQTLPDSYQPASEALSDTARAWYGSNPVEIYTDAKFILTLDHVYPGWIKTRALEGAKEGAARAAFMHFEHFRGKELWLLTTIRSLDPDDPLEVNAKTYVKATSIKMDSGSFALVPLDAGERDVFTHDADSSYRVRIQLFEVDGVAMKREMLRATRSPGIAGAAEDLFRTFAGTAGAIAGDVVRNLFDRWKDEPLAFERLLLTLGATEEFRGELLLVRKGTHPDSQLTEDQQHKKMVREKSYVLVDPFKEAALHGQSATTADLADAGKFLGKKAELMPIGSCWGFLATPAPAPAGPDPRNGACANILDRTFVQFTVKQTPSEDYQQRKKMQQQKETLAVLQGQMTELEPRTSGREITLSVAESLKGFVDGLPPESAKAARNKARQLKQAVDAREATLNAIAAVEARLANLTRDLELRVEERMAAADDAAFKRLDQAVDDAAAVLGGQQAELLGRQQALLQEDNAVLGGFNALVKDLQDRRSDVRAEILRLEKLMEIQSRPYD